MTLTENICIDGCQLLYINDLGEKNNIICNKHFNMKNNAAIKLVQKSRKRRNF